MKAWIKWTHFRFLLSAWSCLKALKGNEISSPTQVEWTRTTESDERRFICPCHKFSPFHKRCVDADLSSCLCALCVNFPRVWDSQKRVCREDNRCFIIATLRACLSDLRKIEVGYSKHEWDSGRSERDLAVFGVPRWILQEMRGSAVVTGLQLHARFVFSCRFHLSVSQERLL